MIQWIQQSLLNFIPDIRPPEPKPPDDLKIVVQPRLRKGWRLEWKKGEAVLTLPTLLAEAPDPIQKALRDWTNLVRRGRRRQRELAPERRKLESSIHAWLESKREEDPESRKRRALRAQRRLERLNPVGRFHHLEQILERINTEYFDGALNVRITWSSRWGGLSTQCTRRDGAGNPVHIITISRGYDHPSATPEIIGGVVYHECLHIAVPPKEGGSRRLVHGREFRLREKQYRHFEVWQRWHRDELPRIIRRRGQPVISKTHR